jgi:hypothetical protein
MSSKQAFNPYLPSWEYIPDGEPYVFDGRVYVYGSHDRFDGTVYCMNDYVTWSAPVDDLGSWRYEGVIYRASQDPRADENSCLYAPDMAQGKDGRFYLYYALHNRDAMGVAVSSSPAGPFEYYGVIQRRDGSVLGESGSDEEDVRNFDPGVLVDDDGRVFLYSGFSPRKPLPEHAAKMGKEQLHFFNRSLGSYCMELESDMLTIKRGPFLVFKRAGDCEGTAFEGHEFFEASSLRKVRLPEWDKPKYYFIYSSINSHELCYALSDKPDSDFIYGGTLISNGDVGVNRQDGLAAAPQAVDSKLEKEKHGILTDSKEAIAYMGNNHGSIVEIRGQWYVFYHRQTNLHQFSRQDCAEPITIQKDGKIPQVEVTSCGLNTDAEGKPRPLNGWGTYESRIACNLYMPGTVMWFPFNGKCEKERIPYFTQDSDDFVPGNSKKEPEQYIANFHPGAVAGYKYFLFDNVQHPVKALTITIRGEARGEVTVADKPGGSAYATIPIDTGSGTAEWQDFSAPCSIKDGKTALFFTYKGSGSFDLLSFGLKEG